MVEFVQAIKSFLKDIRYAWQKRKTQYIDSLALKTHYLENIELFHEKMNNAFLYRTDNDLTKAFDELLSAVNCNDTASLWGRKSSLAKSINDNRADVKGTLIGTIAGYFTSIGAIIPIATEIYIQGLNVFSSFLFWGFLAVFVFGLYTGSFNQNRLRRLVEEHKDYTREFEEITDLFTRKKGSAHSNTWMSEKH